jgi:hypothetical protein
MTRIVVPVAIVCALALCSISLAQATTPPAAPPANPAQAGVERPMPELRLNATGLSDVIDFLTDTTGVNFAVDWKALAAANVTKDTPITLRLGNVSLRKALQLILQQSAGAGVLTFYADQGVVQITTQEQADKELITKIYGIQDLLFTATDYTNAPQLDITQAGQGQQGGRGGGGGSTNLFTNTGDQSNTNNIQTRNDRAQEIIKMITDTVRPEIWQVNGGNATISFIRGNLVVTAPRSVHEMLSSK